MELCLTGDTIGAEEAAQRGMISRAVPADQLIDEAIAIGEKIAQKSTFVMAKMSILRIFYDVKDYEYLKFQNQ